MSDFTCPQCGSHYWGSFQNEDGTWTRMCHGHVPASSGSGFVGCKYKWHQRDDGKNGILYGGESEPQAATQVPGPR